MPRYHDEYDELCALYERQIAELRAAYDEYQANPTPEGYRRCTLLGYSVSDTKWDIQKNFPGRMEFHHLSSVR